MFSNLSIYPFLVCWYLYYLSVIIMCYTRRNRWYCRKDCR